jgi:hypothetical protein
MSRYTGVRGAAWFRALTSGVAPLSGRSEIGSLGRRAVG